MSEQKVYNPREHLVKIKSKDGSLKDYYPAPYLFTGRFLAEAAWEER